MLRLLCMDFNPERHGQLVEHYMRWLLSVADNMGSDAWRKAAVCKYMRKLLRDMTVAELGVLTGQELEELTYHAADGFDRWRQRRLP